MKSTLATLLVAFGITLGNAVAAPLIEYQGTTFMGVTNQNQPLAKVVVGSSNVTIGGFGVYGQAQVAGNVKWLIFDPALATPLVYLSGAQAVAARSGTFASQAMWYDSPAINFTLQAGHTYAMGLIADQVGTNTFRWGSSADNPFGPYPTTTANGLSLPFMQALDNSGVVSGAFTNTPTLYTVNNSNRRMMSLHISAPIPEPAEWTMLIAGLLVIGLIAHRRNLNAG
jgi:hypothetical protein